MGDASTRVWWSWGSFGGRPGRQHGREPARRPGGDVEAGRQRGGREGGEEAGSRVEAGRALWVEATKRPQSGRGWRRG